MLHKPQTCINQSSATITRSSLSLCRVIHTANMFPTFLLTGLRFHWHSFNYIISLCPVPLQWFHGAQLVPQLLLFNAHNPYGNSSGYKHIHLHFITADFCKLGKKKTKNPKLNMYENTFLNAAGSPHHLYYLVHY